MDEWANVSLAELASWLSGGTPNTSVDEYWNGSIPWISAASLKEFLVASSDRNVTPLGVANGTRVVPAGTTIFVVRGMSLMSEFRIGITTREVAFGQDCKALIPAKSVNPVFLAYAIRAQTSTILNLVDEAGHGTGRLQTDRIASLRIPIPDDVKIQEAVVAPLRALDDKAVVNDRIARTCHDLAELYYKCGTRGLSDEPLSSVLDPILGGTPDRAVPAYWGSGHLWASAKDVVASRFGILISTEEEITDLAVTETKAKAVEKGSVILTARGTLGAVARVGQPTSLNQSCYAFTPSIIPPSVLYMTVFHAAQRMLSFAQGTVFSTVNMKTLDHINIASLHGAKLNALECRIAPLLNVIESRVRENVALAKLRDALLPGLMSGEIRVRDAEKIVEDAT